MRDYRTLKVWKKSYRFVLEIYHRTKEFPPEERYGLISQVRRASASIPTNISKRAGRRTKKEFAWFLNISAGSTSEVSFLLRLSRDLEYIKEKQFGDLENKAIEIQKMLRSLMEKLTAKGSLPRRHAK